MTQIMFPLDKAHEALDEFLNREGTPGDEGRYVERWIADEKGEPLAYITPAALNHETVNGYRQWLDSQEVRGEEDDLPPGYRPYLHSPLSMGGERLLPVEPFEEPLARYIFGRPFAELAEDERMKVHGAAIMCVLRVTLDQDGQGAVPILMIGHEPEEPGPALRWQIAYATKVPGLYLRATPAMFSDEWAIITGSGYRLASGWLSREWAEATAEALARTLPGADWMRITPAAFTPKASAAIRATLKRHGYFGLNEKAPEPEVMADQVPAGGEPVAAAAAGEPSS